VGAHPHLSPHRGPAARHRLNTLLHEWTHHYDFHGLRLPRSYHTAGFFARLRALADALEVGFVLPADSDAAGQPAEGALPGRAHNVPHDQHLDTDSHTTPNPAWNRPD
jgi:hypothetical protein